VSPNPMVGAVVARGGEVVGQGWHREHGGPHAEVEALAEAGERARGATLYVTLEPCAHHGNTPPCADAVVAAGIAKVVACHGDPDPRTAGAGFDRLRGAGIEVEVGGLPRLAEKAVELNLHFLVSVVLGRPAVTLKWAMSLDGKIATVAGESQWISSPEGRRWALEQRQCHDAILVGSGTALADDPRLDRRIRPGKDAADRPIVRVLLDRRLRLPPTARMLENVESGGPVLLYTEDRSERRGALEAAGAEVVTLERVDPPAVLADLHRRGLRSVLVEGGGEVTAAFVAAGTFDRVAVDCAPVLLGGEEALGPVRGAGTARLDLAPRLERLRARRRGPDLILTGYRDGCLRDLLRSVGAS
jgi:diaminohydroxyphosphoribosylaminopyrimidine deaminase / 5-amino-6-(5-phosphoribosylamino)uracil reductase